MWLDTSLLFDMLVMFLYSVHISRKPSLPAGNADAFIAQKLYPLLKGRLRGLRCVGSPVFLELL